MLLELEQAYPGLRFDTGFLGSVPVQAEGRLGNRWFYFRFRYDGASLAVGSPNTRTAHGRKKKAVRRARRQLRRNVPMDGLARHMALSTLKAGPDALERHPEYRTRASYIAGVTGDPYAGSLEDAEAGELFSRLMDALQPVPARTEPVGKRFFARSRRGRTGRSETGRHVITKNPNHRKKP